MLSYFYDEVDYSSLHNCQNIFAFAKNEDGSFLGNIARGVTPVPMSNTEVKPSKVDGTIVVRLWESRKLPGYI